MPPYPVWVINSTATLLQLVLSPKLLFWGPSPTWSDGVTYIDDRFFARWQLKCHTVAVEEHSSSASQVASTSVKFIATKSSLMLFNHFLLALPLFERDTRNRWHNLGTTAKQVVMVWACAAKRRQWLGEEMYGVWSGEFQIDQRGPGERWCKKTVKHVNWTGRMMWIIVDVVRKRPTHPKT